MTESSTGPMGDVSSAALIERARACRFRRVGTLERALFGSGYVVVLTVRKIEGGVEQLYVAQRSGTSWLEVWDGPDSRVFGQARGALQV